MSKAISIRGAREHNLRNISIDIPRNSLVVMTGLSGSGKSSLAFDTIYAEGQRRYLESLSAYARQFLEQLAKPDVDSIEGLSPAISVEQKNISKNPRSTVGTITEIYDFLRLLYARVGTPRCFECGSAIESQSPQQIVQAITSLPPDSRFAILAPIVRDRKGEFQKELFQARSQGYARARVDGEDVSLTSPIQLKKTFRHDVSIYIDRLIVKPGTETRIYEAIEAAVQLSNGLAEILITGEEKPRLVSTRFACTNCGTSFPELEPRSFSFNSTHGGCSICNGIGSIYRIDPNLIFLDVKSPLDEAIGDSLLELEFGYKSIVKELPNKSYSELSSKEQKALTEKISAALQAIWDEGVDTDRQILIEYMAATECPECLGTRIRKESRSVFVGEKNIAELCALALNDALVFFQQLRLTSSQLLIAEPILKEITGRLTFLIDVGLSYLTLNRSASTLSGGEAQRIRLASQVGSGLVGVLYVLDEPSIGLHARDNDRLISTLERLRDCGNSVIVVEHDEETIRRSDFIVDIGPGSGKHGGEVIFEGKVKDLLTSERSLTGQYLSGNKRIATPQRRSAANTARLELSGLTRNNLQDISVTFPLGCFIGVSGVSGSGKSTLIIDTLLPVLRAKVSNRPIPPLGHGIIRGLETVERVIHVDQDPIGRTPRSNPATYTGVFTEIRTLFSSTPEAKARGYSLGRFSFNVKGGRCEGCRGEGTSRVSMNFLPDVYVTCEVCGGRRYNRETLEVRYRGRTIEEVLKFSVEEAANFFQNIPNLRFKLQTLVDVGLGYIELGQNAVTLSGGEAQRMKLSRELNRRSLAKTVYILDEPTTGLHFDDVLRLIQILHRLVDQGSTVIVIEHNLDVLKQADYLIELGPEGGVGGGRVLFQGPPEDLVRVKESHTAVYLKKALGS